MQLLLCITDPQFHPQSTSKGLDFAPRTLINKHTKCNKSPGFIWQSSGTTAKVLLFDVKLLDVFVVFHLIPEYFTFFFFFSLMRLWVPQALILEICFPESLIALACFLIASEFLSIWQKYAVTFFGTFLHPTSQVCDMDFMGLVLFNLHL